MEDVRALAPEEARELDERREVAPGPERAPQALQRQEAHAGRGGGVAQGAGPVGGDGDVEAARERREQRGDVGLRAAGLRQGDEQEQARSPRAGG